MNENLSGYTQEREIEYLLGLKELFELDEQIKGLKGRRKKLTHKLRFELGRYMAAEELSELPPGASGEKSDQQ